MAPGPTIVEAEQFEQNLYACLEKACFSRFLELCPGYQADKNDGGLDCRTILWLRLCFELLKLEHENRITPAKALRSSMLLHPNYEEKLFKKLCGDGVIVFPTILVMPSKSNERKSWIWSLLIRGQTRLNQICSRVQKVT